MTADERRAPPPRVIALDAGQRERERILPPGAGGMIGGHYKMLRTQVLKRLDQLGATSLGMLSAASGEGKTLTAINLAIAISAESGRTCLLVDLDLRRPSIHRRLGFSPQTGVEQVLRGEIAVHECMVKIAGYDRLTVVPATGATQNTSELLATEHAAALALELRGRYPDRIVVFDLPPVLAADDVLMFSRNLQAGLLIAAEGRTQRDDIARVAQLLRELTIVGSVLNAARERGAAVY